MAYHRSTAGAYQLWADQVGDDSYTFENLLPYFEKSLNFTPPDNAKRGLNATPDYDISNLGNGEGPLHVTFENYALAFSTWFAKGLAQIGVLPQNGMTSGVLNGSSWSVKTINHDTGARDSSQTAFLAPALKRPNLIIYTRTLARQITFTGLNATGVTVQTETKNYHISAKKEVILSAGTFQSPQMLMVSGIGPAATLESLDIPVIANRPGVGQNMWDHILFGPSYRVNVPTSSSFGDPTFFYESIALFQNEQAGMLSNNGGDMIGKFGSTVPLSKE
jgi:choline dehydrogenase